MPFVAEQSLETRVAELERRLEQLSRQHNRFTEPFLSDSSDTRHLEQAQSIGAQQGRFRAGQDDELLDDRVDRRVLLGSHARFLLDSSIELKPSSFITIGNAQFSEISLDLPSSAQRAILVAGLDNSTSISNTSENTQWQIENVDGTSNSFMYAFRAPLYFSTATDDASGNTITSGESVVNDTTQNWSTNELAGAIVNIKNSDGSTYHETRQIASNTATQITIDGTWSQTVASGGTYNVLMPVYAGSADFPWHRLYVIGTDISSGGDGTIRKDIQLGYGPTSGVDVVTILHGTGSPESVVTANAGSLFLRTDGGATTTLYVKESGTGNTGWVAK